MSTQWCTVALYSMLNSSTIQRSVCHGWCPLPVPPPYNIHMQHTHTHTHTTPHCVHTYLRERARLKVTEEEGLRCMGDQVTVLKYVNLSDLTTEYAFEHDAGSVGEPFDDDLGEKRVRGVREEGEGGERGRREGNGRGKRQGETAGGDGRCKLCVWVWGCGLGRYTYRCTLQLETHTY